MIRQLRKKFIMVAMLSTVLVLALLIGSILVINYHEAIADADELLRILSEHEGTFPGKPGLLDTLPDKKSLSENGTPPSLPEFDGDRPGRWNEETPYETRYFSVLFDEEQQITETETENIAAVSAEEARSYAEEIFASGKKRGFYGHYRYLAAEEAENTRIIFVDCGRTLDNFRNFFLVSIGVSALGLLLVFLLVFFFSKIVFQPVLESDQKQKTFITDASHELKTPLTIIDANTEVLEMTGGENEFTRSIRNQVKRLTNLTQQMVTLTRMDEGRQMGPMTEVPFGEVTGEIADSFSLVAKSRSKSMLLDIDESVTVTGDEAFLSQLVSLLLDNAVKYSDADGNIRVSLHKKGKKAILQISNTASELPKGNLDILFERFYRTDASRNSETGGSGIGLSVAKAIVQAHKGSIHAKSEDGKTIVFTVTLS